MRGRLLLAGAGAVVALLLAEGLARWWLPTPIPLEEEALHCFATDDRMPWKIRSHHRQRLVSREFATTVQTNNLGWRESADWQGEPIDIGVVGDSFTFGIGVDAGQRYADLLRDHLPERRVYSYAYANGFCPIHYLLYLQLHPELIPKILVVQLFVGNDLDADVLETIPVWQGDRVLSAKLCCRAFTEDGYQLSLVPHRLLWPWPTIRWGLYRAAYRSALGRLLMVALRPKVTVADTLSPLHRGVLPATAHQTLRATLLIHRLMENHGGRAVVLLVPEAWMLGDYPLLSPYPPAVGCQQGLLASLEGWLSQRGIPVVNPLEPLIELERHGQSAYFAQDGHWTPAGHRLVAAVLADRIQNNGWLRFSSSAAQNAPSPPAYPPTSP